MWIPEEVAEEMVRSPVQELPVPGIKKKMRIVLETMLSGRYIWKEGGPTEAELLI